MKDLFRERNFFCLWLGQSISSFGDRLYQMACIALISTLLPGSTRAVAWLFTASQLPVLILGPALGVYVDRWDSKRCMLLCDVLRCLLGLLIPFALLLFPISFQEGQAIATLVSARHWLWFLSVNVFLIGALTRIYVPARLSIMPLVISPRVLLAANAMLTSSMLLATVVGLAAGDILPAKFGLITPFVVNAATFLIAGVSIWFLVVPRQRITSREMARRNNHPIVKNHFWHELVEGAHLLVTHKTILVAVGSVCMLTGGAGAIFVLLTVSIKSHFGHLFSGGAYGVFLATLGLGAIVGSLILSWWGHKHPREKMIGVAFFLTGCLSLPFVWLLVSGSREGTMQAFLRMDFVAFLAGVFVAPVMIASDTWLQEIVPEHLRGRIFGSKETLLALAFIAGNMLIGYIAEDMTSTQRDTLLYGVAALLMLLGFAWAFVVFLHVPHSDDSSHHGNCPTTQDTSDQTY